MLLQSCSDLSRGACYRQDAKDLAFQRDLPQATTFWNQAPATDLSQQAAALAKKRPSFSHQELHLAGSERPASPRLLRNGCHHELCDATLARARQVDGLLLVLRATLARHHGYRGETTIKPQMTNYDEPASTISWLFSYSGNMSSTMGCNIVC